MRFKLSKDSTTISCAKYLAQTPLIPVSLKWIDIIDHALTILAITIQGLAPCVELVYIIIPVDKLKAQWNKSLTNSKLATFASTF